MKIAVSAKGPGLESQVDVMFGRCPYFVIVEVDNEKIAGSEDMKNTATAQMGGAGISAAQLVADKGTNAIITGNMGPRAFSVFQQLGIDVYQGSGTVKDAVEKFIKGELNKISEATGPQFMGMPGGGQGAGMGRGMGRGRGRM